MGIRKRGDKKKEGERVVNLFTLSVKKGNRGEGNEFATRVNSKEGGEGKYELTIVSFSLPANRKRGGGERDNRARHNHATTSSTYRGERLEGQKERGWTKHCYQGNYQGEGDSRKKKEGTGGGHLFE